ncbi:T-complex protein 1 subunit theta [Nematocida sp. AWRm80]|nr:T-complex protein 1 subunit theta [Nematocida sp. AWRm80]
MNNAFSRNTLMKTNTAESSGISCVLKNIEGIISVSDMLKTSYGINGTYKLVVNAYNKTIISRSVASILSGCDIEHPALRLIVEPVAHLAQMGDCTGFMMGVLGEILRRSAQLIQKGVIPTEIAAELRECQDMIPELIESIAIKEEFSLTDKEVLKKCISGIVKENKISELLSESISRISRNGSFFIDSIRITKVEVGSINNSERFQGMLLEKAPAGEVTHGKNLKTAIYTCPLAISNMETKGTVLLKTAEDLLTYATDDEKTIKNRIDQITANGIGLLICSGSLDSLMMDYLNEKGVAVIQVHSKFDLKRMQILFGGKMSNTLQPLPENALGYCISLETITYGTKEYTKITGQGEIDTLVIKGSLPTRLEENERIITKAIYALQVCATESMRTKHTRLLKGADHCEKQLAQIISSKAKESVRIRQIILDLIADSITAIKERCSSQDQTALEVYDIAAIKERALDYALVLASDVLSISQMFITKNNDPLQAPKRPPGHWDDREL